MCVLYSNVRFSCVLKDSIDLYYCLYNIKKKPMEVNILAFLATALFILIPTAFLIILYVKTESQAN